MKILRYSTIAGTLGLLLSAMPVVGEESFYSIEDLTRASAAEFTSGETRHTLLTLPNGETREVAYQWVDGVALFEGDIQLHLDGRGRASLNPRIDELPTKGAGRTRMDVRWPGNIVYYTIDPSYLYPSRITVAMQQWEERTPVRFVESDLAPNRIRFLGGDLCGSYVGMIGGEQPIILSSSCSVRTIVHEIGHALGLWHEHTRQDRDQHLIIEWSNIRDGKEDNFQKYNEIELSFCELDDTGTTFCEGQDYGELDPDSIMMYPCHLSDTFAKNPDLPVISPLDSSWCDRMGKRDELSPGDVATVTAMYPTYRLDTYALQAGAQDGTHLSEADALLMGGASSLTTLDVDGDGHDEIVALRGPALWTYRMNPTMSTAVDMFMFAGTDDLAGGDFDGDGDEELAALRDGVLRVYEPQPFPSPLPWLATWSAALSITDPIGLAALDYDGDGTDEIAILNASGALFFAADGGLSLEGLGANPFPGATDLAGVDYDGDGFDELALSGENQRVVMYEAQVSGSSVRGPELDTLLRTVSTGQPTDAAKFFSFPGGQLTEVAGDTWNMAPAATRTQIVGFDHDADGTDEILVYRH